MKTIQFLAAAAIFITTILISMVLSIENPLDRQYRVLIEKIKDQEKLTTEADVIKKYPELIEVQKEIEKIKISHKEIQISIEGPEALSKEETIRLYEKIDSVYQWEDQLKISIALSSACKEQKFTTGL